MTNSKPDTVMPAMKKDTFRARILYAAALLHIHGFTSDAEDSKVKQRIKTWLEKHAKEQP